MAIPIYGQKKFNKMVLLYNDGNYKDVIVYSDSTLKQDSLNNKEEVYLRTYRAYSFVALMKTRKAKNEFIKILKIDSTYTLNPDIVSPKIINVFNEVKDEWLKSKIPNKIPAGKTKISPPLPPSSFTKYTFPGVYQTYLGNKKKGKVLKWGFLGSLGSLIITESGYLYTHYMYEKQTSQPDVDKWYTWYNFFYKARGYSFELTLSIYLFNIIDVSLSNEETSYSPE